MLEQLSIAIGKQVMVLQSESKKAANVGLLAKTTQHQSC